MKNSRGFTIVELLVAIVFLGAVGAVFLNLRSSLASIHRDQDRKIAINAIYYNLEEVVKPAAGGYPRVINATQLKAMDPALLKDPRGFVIGNKDSDYRYEATGCNGSNVCTGYALRADLEREPDFVKMNR